MNAFDERGREDREAAYQEAGSMVRMPSILAAESQASSHWATDTS
jgi:hypothetical protein